MPNLEAMTKDQLRNACREAGIKGWGKLNNSGMRKALAALERFTDTPPVKKLGRNLDSDPGTPDAATEARIDKTVAKSKASKKIAKKSASDQPSIRAWLEQRLAKGELKVADALAFAEQTKRSKVTVYGRRRNSATARDTRMTSLCWRSDLVRLQDIERKVRDYPSRRALAR